MLYFHINFKNLENNQTLQVSLSKCICMVGENILLILETMMSITVANPHVDHYHWPRAMVSSLTEFMKDSVL